MKKISILFLMFLVAVAVPVLGQDDPFEPIVKAFKESDAKALATSFNATIELRLPDNGNTYSSSQGEMIMKDFFKKYPPDDFTVVQRGTTDPLSMFAIGNYLSAARKYQVYIHLQKVKEHYLIQKIKVEEKK